METIAFDRTVNYASSRSGIQIEVYLSVHGNPPVRLMAKVDTGATYCIFERDYADALGIEVEAGRMEHISTATGSFPVYGHTVVMRCLDWSVETMVYFARSPEFSRNVLGQIGWLDHFRIGLVHHDSMMYLSHYDD